jgi:hypothetical protein
VKGCKIRCLCRHAILAVIATFFVGQLYAQPPCPDQGSGAAGVAAWSAANCPSSNDCNNCGGVVTTCNGDFTIELLSVDRDGSLVTFNYEVCKLSGHDLSHFNIGLGQINCLGEGQAIEDLVVECKFDGVPQTCRVGLDPTTRLISMKIDTPSGGGDGCHIYSFTLDESALAPGFKIGTGCVTAATKAGNQDITRGDRESPGYACVCGPVCEEDCEISCEIAAPEVAGVLTGTVTGGTAPYSCTATVAGTGWSVDACDVDADGNILVTYSVEQPADCDGVFTVTVTDANGCETVCEQTVRCVSSCEVSPGAMVVCEGDEDGATFCVSPVGGVGPFTYSWTGPDDFAADTDCITVSTPGVYTVTITDGNGFTSPPCCAVLGTVSIEGPDDLCTFLSGEYCANVNFGEGVDASGLTYSWSVSGSGSIDGASDGQCVSVTADGSPGSILISVAVSGSVSFTCGENATEAFVEETTCDRLITVETCGCTPGFWKNHAADWGPTGYSPNQTVGSVFTGASPYAGSTLMQALRFLGGRGVDGAKQILLRAAVAALLNASHPNVGYGCLGNDPNAVIAFVNTALATGNRTAILTAATFLDNCNNAQDCPLDDHEGH